MGKLTHETHPTPPPIPPAEGLDPPSHSPGLGRVMARRTSAAPLSPCTTRHSVPTRQPDCPAMEEREGGSRGAGGEGGLVGYVFWVEGDEVKRKPYPPPSSLPPTEHPVMTTWLRMVRPLTRCRYSVYLALVYGPPRLPYVGRVVRAAGATFPCVRGRNSDGGCMDRVGERQKETQGETSGRRGEPRTISALLFSCNKILFRTSATAQPALTLPPSLYHLPLFPTVW